MNLSIAQLSEIHGDFEFSGGGYNDGALADIYLDDLGRFQGQGLPFSFVVYLFVAEYSSLRYAKPFLILSYVVSSLEKSSMLTVPS